MIADSSINHSHTNFESIADDGSTNSEFESDIESISDDRLIYSDNNSVDESMASDNDEVVNEVECRCLNMKKKLNKQVEFHHETENEIRIEKLYLQNLLMRFREQSEKCDTLMIKHSKRSDEMHEENALKMKERKRDMWIKMMNILKLKSELKSITKKIDETKKSLFDYLQQQHQQRQRDKRQSQQQQQQQRVVGYKKDLVMQVASSKTSFPNPFKCVKVTEFKKKDNYNRNHTSKIHETSKFKKPYSRVVPKYDKKKSEKSFKKNLD